MGFLKKKINFFIDEKIEEKNFFSNILTFQTVASLPDTIRERNVNNQDGTSKPAQAENQEVSTFPADVHLAILNKTNN